MKLRKCFVLREVEVSLIDIKADDIYRLEKAGPEDPVSSNQWMIAESNAVACDPPGNVAVKSQNVALVPVAGAHHGIFRERP